MGEANKVKFLKENSVEHNILFVGVQETKKTSYGADWLINISGRKNFSWVCVPSVELSGGIMLGVDSDCFEVLEAESGDFNARMTVREKSSNKKWILATVYGAAHGRDKGACLVELVHIFLL